MHQTITCKLKSSKNVFFETVLSQNCEFAIFVPKFTHYWQVNSVCCKSSPYDQAKEFNDFQFHYSPFKPKKSQKKKKKKKKKKNAQIKIFVFLNHFSIYCQVLYFQGGHQRGHRYDKAICYKLCEYY